MKSWKGALLLALLLLALLLAGLVLRARLLTSTIPPDWGSLSVTSEPAGGRVTVDGEPLGEAEPGAALSMRVPPGRHKVAVTLPGYEDWEEEVTVARRESRSVTVELDRVRGAEPPERPAPAAGLASLGPNDHGFEEYRSEKDGTVLVYIPSGPFAMGYGSDRHRVELSGYYLGKFEVTNGQFRRFVEATGHDAGDAWKDCARKSGEDHPVVSVTWDDASAYCRWAGLRLPTEAEWEKAARGRKALLYPWGDKWRPELCNSSESGRGMTTPVGSLPGGASPYGLLDMAGNAGEWCSDWYGDYGSPPVVDPRGPDTGSARVCRGGNWNSPTGYCQAAGRDYGAPSDRGDFLGFRPARSAP